MMTTVSSNELCSWNLLWVGIKCSYYKKVTLFKVFLKILCFDVMINIFCTFVFQFFAASMLLLLLSRFRSVRLCATPKTAATRLPRPWDFPDKNTGAGCHFLLQCMKVKSESEVVESCPTLSNPMDCSLPGSSVHGIFQARVLEWGAVAFSVLLV